VDFERADDVLVLADEDFLVVWAVAIGRSCGKGLAWP
jgi:hypothetical protein